MKKDLKLEKLLKDMGYEQARNLVDDYDKKTAAEEQKFKAVRSMIFKETGLSPDSFGLTPDKVKFDSRYVAAKSLFDNSFQMQRKVNQSFMSVYKKEYEKERKELRKKKFQIITTL